MPSKPAPQVADYGDDSVRWLDTFKRGLHTWMLPTREGWNKLSQIANLDPQQSVEYDQTYRRDVFWWAPLIIAISSINPLGVTSITGCDALFIENQWFEYTTSNKQENASVSFASPIEWFQATWLCNHYGIAREFTDTPDPECSWQGHTSEMEIIAKNAGIHQRDNPGHIERFFARCAGILDSIYPLAKLGINYGSKALGAAVGMPELGKVAGEVAMQLLDKATKKKK
jgi:hypothetical protein